MNFDTLISKRLKQRKKCKKAVHDQLNNYDLAAFAGGQFNQLDNLNSL